jgi:3-methylcrotonyl-CoA carboxylase alpha subunit
MNNHSLNTILIANRGEIALRIIKAVRKAGMKTVVVHTEVDRELPFVKLADESWSLGHGTLAETYLNQQLIIDIAKRSGASAIHPGYGFLSENAAFAHLCRENGITFIGPDPEVIDLMGNKANARIAAKKFEVPVIEGITGSTEEILARAGDLEFPVLIKPAAGGGGKGMHIVTSGEELKDTLADATREAKNYFGSDELYIERYIREARHIEVQVLADRHVNAVHLFERECTLQRRYQKIIEEAPSPSVSDATRKKLTDSALKLTRGINYTNAGTIEYLMDDQENFFFIEMNTRIQVEHPVTEMITGLDIVREQIRIAAGEPLSISQEELKINGHAIEARLYAEDPANEFMPATGRIRKINTQNVSVRLDEGYREGNTITPYYDPMITKVIAHDYNRKETTRQLVSGLRNYHLSGVTTNRDFLVTLLLSKEFTENYLHTRLIDKKTGPLLEQLNRSREKADTERILAILAVVALHHDYRAESASTVWQEIGHWRQLPDIQLKFRDRTYRIPFMNVETGKSLELDVEGNIFSITILDHTENFFKLLINGEQFVSWADVDGTDIILDVEQFTFHAQRMDIPDERYTGTGSGEGTASDTKTVLAPLNGKVVKINVQASDTVNSGDTLMVIESMKMENRIIAPRDAEIEKINVAIGDLVETKKLLITLK